jgi:hypothetical protein
MNLQCNTNGILGQVLALSGKGYRCIPLLPRSKAPAVKWKRYQFVAPSAAELKGFFGGDDRNCGVICGDLVIVDCDDADQVDYVVAAAGDTPYRVRTPHGGMHLGYRLRPGESLANRVRVNGRPIDLRACGGYAVVPPSQLADGGSYQWEHEPPTLDDLPLFAAGWMRDRPPVVLPIAVSGNESERVRRARAYLSKIEGAIAGHRGHDRTFRVACVLTHKFGLGPAEALALLAGWNRRCEPEWSTVELRHKLADALAKRAT